MKKLLILITIVVISNSLIAQTSKGGWLLGGSASFSSAKQGNFKQTDFSIAPDAGYFFIDNLCIGAGIGFSSSKEEGFDAVTSFAFAPFARYYFLPLGPNAKLFANGSFGFGSQSSGGVSQSLTVWGIKAGPAFFLTKNVALEFALGYSSTKIKDEPDAINTFGVSLGFQIHLN